MPFYQRSPFRSRVDWISPQIFMQQGGQLSGLTNILGQLATTPSIPAGSQGPAPNAGMPTLLYHVTVTPAGGAGTYTFTHGLQWTPTFVQVTPQIAQGSTPSVKVGWDIADTTATVVALNFSGNCTADVLFG